MRRVQLRMAAFCGGGGGGGCCGGGLDMRFIWLGWCAVGQTSSDCGNGGGGGGR